MDPLVIAICLFLLAIGLGVLDLFVPSGGVLAILAAIAAVGSVLFGFRSGNTAGMTILTVLFAAIPVFLMIALRIWPHTPIGRLIVLPTPDETASSTEASTDPLAALVGKVGVAQHALMPTGHVRIESRNYNAVAERGLIEAGQFVEVLAVQQRNLVVAVTTRRPGSEKSVEPVEPAVAGPSLLELPAEQLGLDSLDN